MAGVGLKSKSVEMSGQTWKACPKRVHDAGTHMYLLGYYAASAVDANLDQNSTSVVFSGANSAEVAHAFVVAGGAGSTDGSDLVLTVTGTSVSGGVETVNDSEVIVADATAVSANTYVETTKQWKGNITFTLSSTGGTTYSFDFNYGVASYESANDTRFNTVAFNLKSHGGTNASAPSAQIFHHSTSGWEYSAAAFSPGGDRIADVVTKFLSDGGGGNEFFSTSIPDMNRAIDGEASEGVVVRLESDANMAAGSITAVLGILT